MTNPPAVTVIIPNYNHARYLDIRIASVLAQTYSDFELIILDDASRDDSLRVIEAYQGDPRVRVVPNRKNSGSPFKQWNRGLRLATGRFVWIAESDDDAEPEFLATLVRLLEAHPSASLAYCRSMTIDEEGRSLGPHLHDHIPADIQERWEHDFVNNGRDETINYLCLTNTVPNASAVVFRRDRAIAAGAVPSGFRLTGDWLFWARLMALGDVAYTATMLSRFRRHAATAREKQAMRGTLESARVVAWMGGHYPQLRSQFQWTGLLALTQILDRIDGRTNSSPSIDCYLAAIPALGRIAPRLWGALAFGSCRRLARRVLRGLRRAAKRA